MSGKEVVLRPPPPLRTGRETFASSGSSRDKAPHERDRWHGGAPAMSLCDTGLQPPHATHTFGPVDLVGVSRRVRGRTHGQVHVRLLFLVERFHQLSRNARPCWKSARLRGGVMLQLLSAPLQGGLSFLQRSSARHPLSVPRGIACLREAGCRVYHVPFKQHRMI